ncbi:MAG: hypothetical protein JNM56_14090 [Planctomycetia bacterium]|nr:hypothetical protein [Planctomycetia bacterium]
MADDLTLDDFRKQLDRALQNGMNGLVLRFLGLEAGLPESAKRCLQRIDRMIAVMTPEERLDPACIDVNRRFLIALHSDTDPHEVQQFLRQFDQVRELMRQSAKLNIWDRIRLITGYPKLRPFPPADFKE